MNVAGLTDEEAGAVNGARMQLESNAGRAATVGAREVPDEEG